MLLTISWLVAIEFGNNDTMIKLLINIRAKDKAQYSIYFLIYGLKFDLKSVNEFKLNGYNKENNVRDVTVYEYDINQKGEEENDKESNNNSD